MQFHFDAKQSQFHKNGFALRLALKQRHKGTRKWPIVIVKHSMALYPRSSKANQGRPKEGKGCPCSNPGNCLRVMFTLLGGYQLSQSTMVSYAFLPHSSSSCKCKQRERAMLNIQYSPRAKPLLVVFMDAIDLLWFLVPIRLGIRVANPHIKE